MAQSAYSAIDRLTHRVAFGHRAVQDILAEVEAAVFGGLWRDIPIRQPVFITALPRAGTTLLLEVLARLPGLASHTYRDMPFVRAPVLWERLSRGFRTSQTAAERAHGDGIAINPDSPEAFEEVLWLARFPGHYRQDGIEPWGQAAPEFAQELADHMRRIIAARSRGGGASPASYVSKNNANIARIALLRAAFPDARFLIPLRDPLAQAISMHRQHLRFAERHAEDPFARRYMADIGHFEFGADHRPILFEGIDALRDRHRPGDLAYWLGYWTAAYRHLAGQEGVSFLDYAGFCAGGGRNFARLCEELGIAADPAAVEAAGAQIRPGSALPAADRDLVGLAEARELFAELRGRSLFGQAT